MTPAADSEVAIESLADLLDRLGHVGLERIVLNPPPGKATEKHLLRLQRSSERRFELIDSTLVEKVMGFAEACLAADLIHLLRTFLDQHDLGDVAGSDATMRILPGLVRIPDVAFIRWEKCPGRQRPTEPVPGLVPDLAIEILSESNTSGEMRRRRKDYFLAGVTLVWIIDPVQRKVTVYTSPEPGMDLTETDALDGGTVLPGLVLPVSELFKRMPRKVPPGVPRRKRKKT